MATRSNRRKEEIQVEKEALRDKPRPRMVLSKPRMATTAHCNGHAITTSKVWICSSHGAGGRTTIRAASDAKFAAATALRVTVTAATMPVDIGRTLWSIVLGTTIQGTTQLVSSKRWWLKRSTLQMRIVCSI
jgi:hypothetical protein